jgi:hypothetical protein
MRLAIIDTALVFEAPITGATTPAPPPDNADAARCRSALSCSIVDFDNLLGPDNGNSAEVRCSSHPRPGYVVFWIPI